MNKVMSYIGGAGNVFCRRSFELPAAAVGVTVRIAADPHSYVREYCLPLRGDGNDGNWLPGGSFVKFRLYLDGKFIGMGPFRPLTDGVGVEHTFELPPLAAGRHAIGVFSRGEKHGFALELTAMLADGTVFELESDGRWQVMNANAVYSPVCWERPNIDAYFKGDPGPGEYREHIDGRLYPSHWTEVDFDDSRWERAEVTGIGQTVEKADWNYEWEYQEPQSARRTADGRWLLDFGREAIGGIELKGPADGGAVLLGLGEELLDDGHVRYELRTGNCYLECWTFRPGGQRLEHFGLRAFRYAEIAGIEGDAVHCRRLVVRAPFNEQEGKMSCSSRPLSRIWNLCKYTVKATTMDLYTDCFSRERIAYEADSYITMLSHFAVEGNTAPARRTLEYMINHPTWPCEWRQMMIPLFYEYFMHTGDYRLIEKYFGQLADECSYHRLLVNGLIREFPRQIIVDWPAHYRDDYELGPYNTVANAHAYYDLKLLSSLAGYLGRENREFEDLSTQVRESFNINCFHPLKKLYRDHAGSEHCSLHANLFALRFGLVPEERQPFILDFLERKGMVCSIYCAQFLLDALFMYNRAEAAVQLLTARGENAWLHMLDEGATVTWEHWDGAASRAHPWGSSPANLIVRRIFGLRPTRPGWDEFRFSPRPGGLTHGELELPTPRGVLKASFRVHEGKLHTECDFKSELACKVFS